MTPAIAGSAPDQKTLRTLVNSLAAVAALLAVPAALLAAEGSYSYVRTAEGSARLIAAGAAPAGDRPEQLEINQPILTGDQLLAASRSRLDIELSDRNLLRVDGDSELVFAQLAGSGDGDARSTLLRLENGEIQLVVVDDSIGEEFPRVDTANATVYLQSAGTFLVTAAAPDWTTVVVREGSAEVVTRSGSWSVGAGEELRIEGSERARASLVEASAWSALERWGQRLDAEVAAAKYRHVDPSLRYAAAPLERHGSWYNTGGRYAWRPSVGLEWRPYTDGRWVYTPSGLTWVSSEPWGWATSHYGGWDYVSGYGWSWFPGRTYAPAWVYWYWANDYVAWCPTAYYTRFYRGSYGDRFRWGTYGWAGGGWNGFNDWTFCPTRYFGHRDSRRYCLPGSQARSRWNLHEVPRGIVATDTRPITPERWLKPIEAIAALERNGRDTRPGKPGETGALPDVSDFVARRPELTPQVVRTVVNKDPEIGGTRGVRRDRDNRDVADVNGEMEPRLPTNVLTPGHTSEDGKPPSPSGTAHPDFRLATPRDSRGGAGETDPSAHGNQPAGGDWRTARPLGDTPAVKTPRPSRERVAVPTGTKPAAPVSDTPSAIRPVQRKPTAAAPAAGGNWREGGAVRSTVAPRPTRSRESTPAAAPTASASPTPRTAASDDWRQPATRKPVAAPRGKPESSPTFSTPTTGTPRPAESRPAETRSVAEDWRARDGEDSAPAPSARVLNPRGSDTPTATPDRTESPAVRRIMDGIGVGMGRPAARTQPTPAPTPRASSPRPSSPPTAAPTAKPVERRPSSPPPATERRERSSSRDSGERRAKDRNNDSDPPR